MCCLTRRVVLRIDVWCISDSVNTIKDDLGSSFLNRKLATASQRQVFESPPVSCQSIVYEQESAFCPVFSAHK
jgi:hypothetical protein